MAGNQESYMAGAMSQPNVWQSCVLARRLVPGIDACNVQRGSFTLYHIDGFTTP